MLIIWFVGRRQSKGDGSMIFLWQKVCARFDDLCAKAKTYQRLRDVEGTFCVEVDFLFS